MRKLISDELSKSTLKGDQKVFLKLLISPYRGGMSTTKKSDPNLLFKNIKEDVFNGKRIVFKILKTNLEKAGFKLDDDGVNHMSVQPGKEGTTEKDFQKQILQTRDLWTPK